MVEDISFPKNLPKVSSTKRVERTVGQDSEKKSTTSNPTRANHENTAVQTADKSDGSENDMQGKRIDVHV